MLDYSPTKTQKLLGNPDKSANPTASSLARAGLAGEHCICTRTLPISKQLTFLFALRVQPRLVTAQLLHHI